MATLQRRKYRRFALRCPIRVQFRSSNTASQVDGVTKNVSIGGLLLDCPSRIPKHCPVIFTIMAAEGGLVSRPLQFAGEAKVVRIEPDPSAGGFAIALKYVRPIECHPIESRDRRRSRTKSR